MNPCEGTMGATALANLVAESMSDDELKLLVLSVVQFKVTLENILLTRAVNRRQQEECLKGKPSSDPVITRRITPGTSRL